MNPPPNVFEQLLLTLAALYCAVVGCHLPR